MTGRRLVAVPARSEAVVTDLRPRVEHVLTRGQLDAALTGAGWASWSGRDSVHGACPLAVVDVPGRARAWARRQGVTVPDTCLRVDPVVGSNSDWLELLVHLTYVAGDAILEIVDRKLVHEEVVQSEGVARYLLGVTVAGAAAS